MNNRDTLHLRRHQLSVSSDELPLPVELRSHLENWMPEI